ncbi:MAG: pilus assembly protein PilM [Candidatus Babeliaceae bacterium]|nr:pilus assembly protein PilM [Candidatus Babeliaceae bacterium]
MIATYLEQVRLLFLPDSLYSYYITTQKLVGIEIHQNIIFVTIVLAQGHKKTIINCFQQEIIQDGVISLEERIEEALKKIATNIGAYDQLIVTLPNNVIIFKEITIPFTDINTIKMVAPFEIEPMLPFSLNDAFIDALVVSQNKNNNTVIVQVAAIKKSTVAQNIALFNNAGLKPTKFSIHLFEFYSIFKEIPEYHAYTTSTLCIEITHDSCQFIAIVDGQLRNIRITSRGYNDSRFLQDVQFTLDTFNGPLPQDKKISHILIALTSIDSKMLINQIAETTGLKTEDFLLYKVVHNNTIKAINGVLLTTQFIGSMGAALDLSYTRSINFLQGEYTPHNNNLLFKQLLTAFILFIIIIGSLVIHTQLTQRKIKKEINASQEEAKQKLARELNLPKQQVTGKTLERVIDNAKAFVKKQEEIWFALSSQNRYSFLNYLQELFRRLDAKALGLSLTMLSVNDTNGTITLEGEVRDYNALLLLDQELSRPNGMFKEVTHPQEPKFSIKITLDKNYKED